MNNALFLYIHSFSHNYFIGNTAVLLDKFTYVILFLILAWCLLFAKHRLFTISILILSSGTAWLVAHSLKVLFHVARPFVELGVTPLVYLNDYSFPSEHSTIFSALAVAMLFVNRKAGIVLSVLAIAVGLSRIVIGVHYPFDILGGFMVGTLVAILFVKFFKRT